ncbi:hypothetical protein FS837_005025 [Tulasnella sp. UAMH 9824]|nr:hypothetical protein FS837_005025 [Tulasnella sp. UAMH 9824]
MTDSVDDYDAYLGPVGEEDLKWIDEKVDEVSKRFAALKSPSKASTSRAKPPESDEPNKSDTDFPTQPQPSMSPDRPTKRSGPRQSLPRKPTSGKRSSAGSNSALAVRSSRCPAPKQSPVKPLSLRRLSPAKVEPLAAPASESRPPVEEVAAPLVEVIQA